MSAATILLILLVGLVIGVVSGMVGIGGGVLVIPALMFGFGFSQVRANGTSLAMLVMPVGAFAVLTYWRADNVDWRYAGLLAAGYTAGAYVGARLVNTGAIDPAALRVLFAGLLLYVAGRILFQSDARVHAAVGTSLLVAAFAGTYVVMRLLGRRWDRRPPDWAAVYRRRLKEPSAHDYEI